MAKKRVKFNHKKLTLRGLPDRAPAPKPRKYQRECVHLDTRSDLTVPMAGFRTLTVRKKLMDNSHSDFGLANSVNTAGLEIKMAMLEFSQKIRQYQLDCIKAELANYAAATTRQKSTRGIMQSQKFQLESVGNQYVGLINYWTGLSQMMLQGTTQMAMAIQKCGVNTAHGLREQTGLTAMPDYLQSAIDAGMGYSLASFEASQRYAMDNAHAVLDSAEEQAVNGTGKHSKSSGRVKHNSRHGVNGATA